MYLGFHARVMTEASASVCLILATALFVRQATEPACLQSLCHIKKSGRYTLPRQGYVRAV